MLLLSLSLSLLSLLLWCSVYRFYGGNGGEEGRLVSIRVFICYIGVMFCFRYGRVCFMIYCVEDRVYTIVVYFHYSKSVFVLLILRIMFIDIFCIYVCLYQYVCINGRYFCRVLIGTSVIFGYL